MNKSRKATNNDIDGINAVIEANNRELYAVYRYPGKFYGNENLNSRNRTAFVTEVDSTIIAFLTLEGENILNEDCEAKIILVVHPNHRDRKKHYGEKLLKHVISYVITDTSISCIVAGILKENKTSINLCEKCGFLGIKSVDDKSKGIEYRFNLNR